MLKYCSCCWALAWLLGSTAEASHAHWVRLDRPWGAAGLWLLQQCVSSRSKNAFNPLAAVPLGEFSCGFVLQETSCGLSLGGFVPFQAIWKDYIFNKGGGSAEESRSCLAVLCTFKCPTVASPSGDLTISVFC